MERIKNIFRRETVKEKTGRAEKMRLESELMGLRNNLSNIEQDIRNLEKVQDNTSRGLSMGNASVDQLEITARQASRKTILGRIKEIKEELKITKINDRAAK